MQTGTLLVIRIVHPDGQMRQVVHRWTDEGEPDAVVVAASQRLVAELLDSELRRRRAESN